MNANASPEIPDELWPGGTVTALSSDGPPHRLLSMVLPAIGSFSRRNHWTVWVAPPYLPSAQLLVKAGLTVSRTLVVYRRDGISDFELIEQALSSPTNDVVLAWPRRLSADMRLRLLRAARAGGTRGVMFPTDRADTTQANRLPASRRAARRPSEQLSLDVVV